MTRVQSVCRWLLYSTTRVRGVEGGEQEDEEEQSCRATQLRCNPAATTCMLNKGCSGWKREGCLALQTHAQRVLTADRNLGERDEETAPTVLVMPSWRGCREGRNHKAGSSADGCLATPRGMHTGVQACTRMPICEMPLTAKQDDNTHMHAHEHKSRLSIPDHPADTSMQAPRPMPVAKKAG